MLRLYIYIHINDSTTIINRNRSNGRYLDAFEWTRKFTHRVTPRSRIERKPYWLNVTLCMYTYVWLKPRHGQQPYDEYWKLIINFREIAKPRRSKNDFHTDDFAVLQNFNEIYFISIKLNAHIEKKKNIRRYKIDTYSFSMSILKIACVLVLKYYLNKYNFFFNELNC